MPTSPGDKFAAIARPDRYEPVRPSRLTARQRREYTDLHTAWQHAAKDAEDGSDGAQWERLDIAAQRAYDSLVDWVEENDLNYTAQDPRGPRLITWED